jgi:hypothetical protein
VRARRPPGGPGATGQPQRQMHPDPVLLCSSFARSTVSQSVRRLSDNRPASPSSGRTPAHSRGTPHATTPTPPCPPRCAAYVCGSACPGARSFQPSYTAGTPTALLSPASAPTAAHTPNHSTAPGIGQHRGQRLNRQTPDPSAPPTMIACSPKIKSKLQRNDTLPTIRSKSSRPG